MQIFFQVFLFLIKKHLPLQANFYEIIIYKRTDANDTAVSKKGKSDFSRKEQSPGIKCLSAEAWGMHTCLYNHSQKAKFGYA